MAITSIVGTISWYDWFIFYGAYATPLFFFCVIPDLISPFLFSAWKSGDADWRRWRKWKALDSAASSRDPAPHQWSVFSLHAVLADYSVLSPCRLAPGVWRLRWQARRSRRRSSIWMFARWSAEATAPRWLTSSLMERMSHPLKRCCTSPP